MNGGATSLKSQLEMVLNEILANMTDPEGDDGRLDELIFEFERISEHPEGSNLMFWPKPGADTSINGIVAEVERWRLENGLPGLESE
ncbi:MULTISPECIES: bacteriocin immunity protein [Pseudomonas]|uniref:Bacteriocin immunity protein n=1 Tax=Pseudomonas quercus TaxID=2722792 RepID=A0ABX0YDI1_9PSED|nr:MULTISPECIES: bacteriocin immunity protein [Pseudomonas]MBF7142548.1 bacteriocin immunity protein [Pseudomonas sp. LY10J]NJP01086.1 bacteriocin immunity protein [Pseudomonas quercus]